MERAEPETQRKETRSERDRPLSPSFWRRQPSIIKPLAHRNDSATVQTLPFTYLALRLRSHSIFHLYRAAVAVIGRYRIELQILHINLTFISYSREGDASYNR